MLTLSLLLALLPPEAHRLNRDAMVHYDAGRWFAAVEGFRAAYAAIPADRGHLRDRNSLLGSMRATLLEAHEKTGAPAPLCKLHEVLQAHLASTRTILADEPEHREVNNTIRLIGLVDEQLADHPAKVCDPEPAPVVAPAPIPVPPPPVLAPVPRPVDPGPTREPARPSLRVAGTLLLGGGVALLGAMTAGVVLHARTTDRLEARARDLSPGRPVDAATWTVMHEELDRARLQRGLAIGAGISGALTLGSGVALLLVGRGRDRQRLALAPWWLSSGTGLTLRVHLP